MSKKVYVSGNYFYIDDTILQTRISGLKEDFEIVSPTTQESSFTVMKDKQSITSLSLNELVKEDGVSPYTFGEFILFIENNTGTSQSSSSGGDASAANQEIANQSLSEIEADLSSVIENGRFKVSSQPSPYLDITGDITAIQATINTPVVGGTVTANVSTASNLVVFCNGIFAGVNITFEGSLDDTGDSNWFGVQAVRTNANTIETATGVLSAQPIYAWELSVNALKRFRVRCTARTSGTQSWKFVLGTYATEPIPAAQVTATQPVSGTVTANIGTGSLAAGTNLIGDIAVQYRANATGAASRTHLVSAATTNATIAKASPGRLVGWSISNTNAAWRYVKLHNQITTPTAGSGVVQTLGIPPNSVREISLPGGIGFTTGIAFTTTTGAADSDTTAVGAGDLVIDLFWA